MSTRSQPGLIFRNTPADLLPLLTVVAYVGAMVGISFVYQQLSWPWLTAALLFLVLLASVSRNSEHYATHTPIFVSPLLNRACQLLFSVAYARPSSGYSRGHLFHHEDTISYSPYRLRESVDMDSWKPFLKGLLLAYVDAFRLGTIVLILHAQLKSRRAAGAPPAEKPRPEHFERMSDYLELLVGRVFAYAGRTPAFARWALVEASVIAASRIALCLIDYQCFFLFLVPLDYLDGMFSGYTEYCTHFGAPANERSRDAASCYAPLFNLLWFNFGYHQEHHHRPGLHWTRLPEVRQALPPPEHRRVVPYLIWFNPLVPLRPSATPESPSPATPAPPA